MPNDPVPVDLRDPAIGPRYRLPHDPAAAAVPTVVSQALTSVTKYFEDFTPGSVFELGSVDIERDEVMEYGRRFDPQPLHTDPDAASRSPYGGLIASGWHTVGLFMKLYVPIVLADADGQGSPGVDSVRWFVPVRPGDRLVARATIEKATPSKRNRRRGTVLVRGEMTNQDGVLVMQILARALFGRRPAT